MKHRLAVILPTYLLMYALCYAVAFLLRFEFAPTSDFIAFFWLSLPAILLIKGTVSFAFGEWRRTFRYATMEDLIYIVGAAGTGAAVVYACNFVIFTSQVVPRSVILIDSALTILAGGLLRFGMRLFAEKIRPLFDGTTQKRTLIYSAGSHTAAIAMYRALQSANTNYKVIGFVHDSPVERASRLASLPVFNLSEGWSRLARRLQARHVLIPSTIPGRCVREILKNCSDAGLEPHVVPALDEIIDGRFKLKVRNVEIADLLRREPAQLDFSSIRQYVSNRRVLVTGAAGSIGSELCRQLLDLEPASMVLVDQSEFGIFNIAQEFGRQSHQAELHYVVADVVDRHSMQRVMEEHRPNLVFHAAAYKHVPLMQQIPQEAIRNNISGTMSLVDLADEFGIERFVLISTDKAVHPTSVMGATKLLSEKYLQGKAAHSKTRFITVRFGNVLDSAGSVVPTFRKQIEQGGPITVTHPDMERFFMTIPEAVQLVLQAGAIGNSGDVLILDMGKPVKIVDLAKDMIYLSGFKYPGDIDIVFTGIRPGEKLFEELFYDSEHGALKVHEKIYRASQAPPELAAVQKDLALLLGTVTKSRAAALAALESVVAHYADANFAPKFKSAA